jgi:hypothetical protein
MKRAAIGAVGLLAGAFVAGFLARALGAFRDLAKSLDREDAELTRRWIKDEVKDELRKKLDSL